MEIIIIIALVLLNGIFSLAEMSLVSSRKFKLELSKKKGNSNAGVALDLHENPTRFLSTVQIRITLIGILLGVYSGENLTKDVHEFLYQNETIRPYAANLSVGIIVIFVTYLSIVLGELLPKRLGMTFPEPIALLLAKPMYILSLVTSPFVWLLTATNNVILQILGIKKTSESRVTEEEIKSIIKESAEGGEIQDIEQNIVERVFELGDRKVNSLFTHRSEIVFFNTSDSWEEIKRKINEEKHSAYPVCVNNNLDHIVGMVLLKDLFRPASDEAFKIENHLRKPVFLNENTFTYKALEIFKKERMHYGLVVDEYGTILGIITMDDVIDALVGDVSESDQSEYQIVERDDSSWLVDGQYPIIEFMKYFGMNTEDLHEYKFATVAGLIIWMNNVLPEVGDVFVYENYQLEVVDKDGHRIDKILVSRLT